MASNYSKQGRRLSEDGWRRTVVGEVGGRRPESSRFTVYQPTTVNRPPSTIYGIVYPLNTHVAPTVNPKPGSRDVMPRSTPASIRTVPRVNRPPMRIVARLSVPGGASVPRVFARPLISPTT